MSKIIVALDGMTTLKALDLANALTGKVAGFKFNDLVFTHGSRLLREFRGLGLVMADYKLYDIPNTVTNAIRSIVEDGADLITVHASGGPTMVKAAVDAAGDKAKIVAVTALTSMSGSDLVAAYRAARYVVVSELARLAVNAGAYGIVCAPTDMLEVKDLKIAKIMPGFRPTGKLAGDDQVETGGAAEVAGADYVVIGRPITRADDPVAAAISINEQLEKV